jgi:hypothetical protein
LELRWPSYRGTWRTNLGDLEADTVSLDVSKTDDSAHLACQIPNRQAGLLTTIQIVTAC